MTNFGTGPTMNSSDRLRLMLVCGSILVVAGSIVLTAGQGAKAMHSRWSPGGRVEPEPCRPSPSPLQVRPTAPPPARSDASAPARSPALPGVAPEGAPAPIPNPSGGALDAKQAAVRVREMAAAVQDPGDVAGLARALAGDAELGAELLPVFEALARSQDPAERLRGTLFLAALDPERGVYRWRDALAGESSGPGREALLTHAPVSGDPRRDAPYVDTLLDCVEREREESGRRAALLGLPAELAAESLDRLAVAVRQETAPELRREAAWLLSEYRSPRPAVVDALDAIGGAAREEFGARLHALRGLLQIEREHPGTLGKDRVARVRATLDGLERDDLESSGPPSPGRPVGSR